MPFNSPYGELIGLYRVVLKKNAEFDLEYDERQDEELDVREG